MKRQIRAPGSWTLEEVIERSKIFGTTVEWRQKDPSSYNAAMNHSWYNLPEVSGHMRRRVHFNKKWTKEAVLADAKGYKTIGSWTKARGGAVSATKKMGIYKTAVAHMEKPKNLLKWSKEAVIRSAQKFDHKSKWRAAEGGAYSAAVKKGWYAEATAHMKILNPKGKWNTKKAVIEEAKRYKTKSDWQNESVGSYEAAKRMNCFDKAVQHMSILRKKWTKDEVLNLAKQFSTIAEWRKNNSKSYMAARRHEIVDIASAHMKILNPIGRWAKKDVVLSDAKNYSSRTHWARNSAGAYASAKRNGWFDEATMHMNIS